MHNLCQEIQPPIGTKNLLGLGLKFCTAPPIPTPNIKDTLKKLAYRIRTKHFLDTNVRHNNSEYIPQLYIKIKGWNPPPAPLIIENQITNFEKIIKTAIQTNADKRRKFFNLTSSQLHTLTFLKKSKDFIIQPSDKNLGPTIMNYRNYIECILQEHLLTTNYQQLPNEAALYRIESTKLKLRNVFNLHKNKLTQAEVNYFTRSFTDFHRNPVFYGMPKVHKSPLSFRPVVSCVNSFPSIFSTWLDFRMKQLLQFIPSYIKDSKSLISELKTLEIPPGAKLFTADATAMYTNIDVDTGLLAFQTLFSTYKDLIPPTFPTEMFLYTLETVMKNNVFTFGDTFWLQLKGTAMGTPAAPLYSIITFGMHENRHILNQFQRNIFYYKRYIDDILGIWLESSELDWQNFKATLNQFGSLKWNIEDLTTSTTFLDLHISIQRDTIHTSTFQKPMNLYTYIPPLSAHPNSCFKGFITGEILRYWSQNSDKQDFVSITSQFIQRLVNRGHPLQEIIKYIKSAAISIDKTATGTYNRSITINENTNNDETLYIHWRHHPYDIPKQTLRNTYNNTLKGIDGFAQMRIATSRQKKIREILCRSQLDPEHDIKVSNILNALIDQTGNSN